MTQSLRGSQLLLLQPIGIKFGACRFFSFNPVNDLLIVLQAENIYNEEEPESTAGEIDTAS